MTAHTPTPWHLDNDGQTVVGADGIQICTPHGLRHPQPAQNAAFIVRAANSHEELLEMVKEMYSAITNGHSMKFTNDDYKQAIAKAEGK